MRKSLIFLMILAMGLVASCGDDNTYTSNNAVPNNEFNKTGKVFGTIFDATTGARLTGQSLTVTLVRDGMYQGPAVLRKGDNETSFAGDYAFTGVPVTMYEDHAEYRIMVQMEGYQDFVGCFDWDLEEPPTAPSDDCCNNNQTIDTQYNQIKNIYLFPLDATAPDVNIWVEYDQERVAGATVHLQQLIGSNSLIVEDSNRLYADSGLSPSIAVTTDTNGQATFPSANLVLGGYYNVYVLPFVYEGVQLRLTDGPQFTVGTQNTAYLITMLDNEPDWGFHGLWIAWASNYDPDDLIADGVLTIQFSRAIALVDETIFRATLVTDGAGVLTDPAGEGAVTATVSGTTLTLTPNFATALDATDTATQITYSVTPQSSPVITLDGDEPRDGLLILQSNGNNDQVRFINSSFVNRVVRIRGAQ